MNIPRLVIAGTHSGVGKTTIVTGLLAALKERGLRVQAYKVGPDYIDTGFHSLACGRASHNLDTWLVPQAELTELFLDTAADSDIAVIEGVMGLYDGGRNGISSTAAIAKQLAAPVVLVIDASSMGESAAAIAFGYKNYDPAVNLVGVIINRIGSDNHAQMVREAVEKVGIRVLGVIRRNKDMVLPERHLGLLPIAELTAVEKSIAVMSEQVRHLTDIDALLELAKSAKMLDCPRRAAKARDKKVRIGVASDEAFSFYYPAALKVLGEMGAELVPFSPIRDKELPTVQGLIFGGGFPEMFLQQLADNQSMIDSIRTAAGQGTPIVAECGGYMYLCRSVTDFDGKQYSMAGLIAENCRMEKRLQTVGYVEATALVDNVLCRAGETLRGHEFHFSRMEPADSAQSSQAAFQITKNRTGLSAPGGFAGANLVASYLHIHFAGNLAAARRFVEQCANYRNLARRES